MSRLEELIQELCPDGVSLYSLGEVCEIRTGKGITKKDSNDEGNFPIISGGKKPMGFYNSANRKANTVTISRVGANAGFVNYIERDFYLNDKCFSVIPLDAYSRQINRKYLFLILKKNEKSIMEMQSEGGVPTINIQKLAKVCIPIPPLSVQEELVCFFDGFTEKIEELQECLYAEIQVRKKQYEYYASKMFPSVKNHNIEWVELGSVATVTKLAGFEFTNYVTYSETGNIIALRGLNVKNGRLVLDDVKYMDNSQLEMLTRSKLHIGDMLFTYVGTIGQVALVDEEDRFYLAPNVAMVRLNTEQYLSRYMMYYFLTEKFRCEQISKLLQTSSMQNIPMEKIRKFKLPKISIAEQEKVISFFERFDEFYNDISEGLSVELDVRQKQYEYYRDKLLTFKERTI